MLTFTNIDLAKGPSLLSAHAFSSSIVAAVVVAISTLSLFGCSTHADSSRRAYTPAEEAALASDFPGPHRAAPDSEALDYDPWESFNERTFSFNFNVLDHYALKPAAEAWTRAVPLALRHGLANVFDNLAMPRRFVNKILQGRLPGAGEELARFVLNSTVGVAGFLDVAARLGLHESDADTGQTLGVYGIKPGPYLVLPVLPPLMARRRWLRRRFFHGPTLVLRVTNTCRYRSQRGVHDQ